MAETDNTALTRLTVYAHGTIGIPLAVIGYPLAIWARIERKRLRQTALDQGHDG